MTPTPDSLAILLLCSHAGLPPDPDPAPFSLREWNGLVRKMQTAKERPAALLGKTEMELRSQFGLEAGEAARAARLIQRGGSLAIELERLAGLGIHAMTRADSAYPERFRQRLKDSAPAVIFYAGEPALLGQPGIAVVGSRNLDEAGQACAEFVGNACGHSGLVLYTGGARGVDTISMNAALEARGTAVGLLADSLEKAVRDPQRRAALSRGDLCLATPYSPSAPFSVGAAMGRNRLIYCLADYAVVVASDVEKGGTWAGAVEALKAGWVPVFVLHHSAMPAGNQALIQRGGIPFPHPFPQHFSQLPDWLKSHSPGITVEPFQPGLFSS